MIGHKAEAVHFDIKLRRLFDKVVQIVMVVLSLNENSAAIVATLYDMVRRVGQDNARSARHLDSVLR